MALDLVTKSIQTTRRFDSLKLYVSLRTLGRQRFAALIERTVDLAAAVAGCIDADPFFERVAPVAINAVVFRCADQGWSAAEGDRINTRVRRARRAAAPLAGPEVARTATGGRRQAGIGRRGRVPCADDEFAANANSMRALTRSSTNELACCRLVRAFAIRARFEVDP